MAVPAPVPVRLMTSLPSQTGLLSMSTQLRM